MNIPLDLLIVSGIVSVLFLLNLLVTSWREFNSNEEIMPVTKEAREHAQKTYAKMKKAANKKPVDDPINKW